MAVAEELLTLRLPAVPASVGEARRAASAVVSEGDSWLVPELLLVVSELVSNAVEHGSVEGDLIELDLSRRGDCLRVAVRDAARNRGSVPIVLSPDDERLRGRGLHVVEGLATDWGELITDGRREVWAEFRGTERGTT